MSKIKAVFVALALGLSAIGAVMAASTASHACSPADAGCGN